ncbi:MAG: hypothetical protein Q9195_007859 [Heterodermia aff. obscurata]
MSSFILSPAEEYDLLVDRNEGLGQLFYDHVKTDPEAVAVVDGESSLTYIQLDLQSSYLAQQSTQDQLRLEEPVGIVVQHGISDVVAQLAIIYAGGSCVAMDPALQDRQIERRLQRLEARYILIDDANKGRNLPFLHILIDGSSIQKPAWYSTATDLQHRTHLIYTSGTTSEPKIVQIAARSILHVIFHAPFEPLSRTDVVSHTNNSTVDVSLFDIWAPLLRGARIAVMSKAVLLDPPVMADYIESLSITVMVTTTAILNLTASTFPRAFAKLRLYDFGGEAANVTAIAAILNEGPPTILINAYGPTECCMFCLAHRVTLEDVQSGSVSIGLPIGRTFVYIADAAGQASDEGELWIGGVGISSGYVNQAELNTVSFTTVESLAKSSERAVRLYKTGDIVRRRLDGQIDFVGRRDHQVKIQGYRVELGAIENALLKIGQFSQAVALKIDAPQQGAGSMLVAYVVPMDVSRHIDLSQAAETLKLNHPGYMIPRLELIARMPLTGNGKVDRSMLTKSFYQRWKDNYLVETPNKSQEERSMLEYLWADILPICRPLYQDEDDFFDLGGTSLQASLLISQIRRTFGLELSILTLYDNSTLGSLTSVVRERHHVHQGSIRDETEVWLADSKLADDLPYPNNSELVDWCRDTEGRVFLTGGTGFVGAFMLADLLRMPRIHEIGCLVRAGDATDGLKRLRYALTKYNLWEEGFKHKLLVLPGQLEDEYLGLGPERFEEIATWASVVFHLGAQALIRFACTGRMKAVHYLSSISCFGPTGFINGVKTIPEDEPLMPHLGALVYDHGYAQSQWVVEELLRRLIDRKFPVVIYRPGFITGHSQTGVCNPDDFFSRLIQACCEIGYYPQLPGQRKELVPVDYVSSVILHIATLPLPLGRAYHIVPPDHSASVDFNTSMELIGEVCGSLIRGVTYGEWIDWLEASPPGRLQPLLPMLAEKVLGGLTRWELYERMPVYEAENTVHALANHPGGLQFPVYSSAIAKRYLDYLQGTNVDSKPQTTRLHSSVAVYSPQSTIENFSISS